MYESGPSGSISDPMSEYCEDVYELSDSVKEKKSNS